MKKNAKYNLIFRITEDVLLPFYIDLFLLHSDYGKVNFVAVGDPTFKEMYLEEKDAVFPAKIGLDLYSNTARIKKMIAAGHEYGQKEKQLPRLIANLPRKSDTGLLKILNDVCYDFCKLLDAYSYTEVMYSPMIERTIREYITSLITDNHNANNIFSILVNPSNKQKIIKERERFYAKNKTPRKIIDLCWSVRKVGVEKLALRLSLMNFWGTVDLILDEIAHRAYMSPKQIKACYFKEIKKILAGDSVNKKKLEDAANERLRNIAGVKIRGKWTFYTGKKAVSIINRVRPKVNKNIHEFKGDIASLGVKRGRVVILPTGLGAENIKELNDKTRKMSKGDILVAKTTGPEMIMACKKAGAIVAEEGGINSHAAIISRELGIPGLVNTSIATLVLRDGDLVEVDANKGLVKIIKKYDRKNKT